MTEQLELRTRLPDAARSAPLAAPRAGRRVWRVVGIVAVAGLIGGYLIAAVPTTVSALRHLAGASTGVLLLALAASVASMIAFAAARSQTLAVAGSPVPLRATVAVSYGAGAVHLTLPGGSLFSTTYAFRRLRSAGASTAAASWSLAVTGLLSTVTLAGLGLFGLLLTGSLTGQGLPAAVAEIAAVAVVIVGGTALLRHPAGVLRLAERMLHRWNGWRRRPVETGIDVLHRGVADLRAIRPAPSAWAAAITLCALNWLLDLGVLAACCAAVGVQVSPGALVLTYTAGMAAASLLPVPAGLGAVETTMTVALTVAGAVASPALAAVLLYRMISSGSVLVIGWLVVATGGRAGGRQFDPNTDTPTGVHA